MGAVENEDGLDVEAGELEDAVENGFLDGFGGGLL